MSDDFVFEGIRFTTINARPNFGCDKCSFYSKQCSELMKKDKIPYCQDWKRKDQRDVIFLQK